MKKDELLNILKKDPIKNMSVIGFVENNPIQEIYNNGDSFLIVGKSDHLWNYLVSSSLNELELLLKDTELKSNYFANIEDWMVPIIVSKKEIDWRLKTRRYYFPKDLEIEKPKYNIDKLREKDIETILKHSNYSEHLSYDLLLKRITEGISACIREDGKAVAWGATHDDKSLGFLHVIEGYRNKGYAKDIGRALINKKKELNELPYLNIECENEKSIKLSEGLGFRYDRNISWIKLK
ncbi:MAG: GNAT family N-acetyltransferase [Halanaerobiales bacterium]|nr:GNAT family N-acetyltransferase [Halanaerobiales bacterium]